MGHITNAADGLQYLAECDLVIVPAHSCPVIGIVDGSLEYTGQCIEVFFVEPDTGGTHDAFEDQ